MPVVDIPFGEWTPDRPDRNNGLVIASGVFADAGCYRPIASLVSTGVVIPGGICAGAYRSSRADGLSMVVVGTSADLHVIVGGSVISSGLALSLGPTPIWLFERFGSWLFATSGGLTYYLPDIDISTVFVAAPGAPPRAKALARVADHLIMGNLVSDIDASVSPYRIRWGAFNNPTATWTDDMATESGAVDMSASYGEVTAIAGGRYGLICQEGGISRIVYTGGTSSFSKELIDEDRGCIAPASLVRVGAMAFGLGNDGFWQSNGAGVQLVSSGRVWEWFRENAEPVLVTKTQAVVDYGSRSIRWNFFGTGATSRNMQLIWSWEQNRWTSSAMLVDWLFSNRQAASLSDSAELGEGMVDDGEFLVDAPGLSEGARLIHGMTGVSLDVGSGAAVGAIFETGEIQPTPGYRAFVSGVTPLIEGDAGSVAISIGTRAASTSEAVSYTAESVPGAQGFAPVRRDGRYIRAKARIPAGTPWTKASGLQVSFTPGGRS